MRLDIEEMKLKLITMFAFMLLITACNGQQKNNKANPASGDKTFKLPEIPSVITSPSERAAYLVAHYWDNFNFLDTSLVHMPDISEQALCNYIDALRYGTAEDDSLSIMTMLHKAAADSTMYGYFVKLYEKYLYDPNSPQRNENLYIYVLRSMLAEPVLSPVNKIRPQSLLDLAVKNRIGSKATDFTYTLSNGSSKKMSMLKTDYLFLYFYDPECENCKKVTEEMKSSNLLREAIATGKVKILCVYPDEDMAAWHRHLSNLPSEWINSYDHTISIKNNQIYDLKAMPTIYLLNKDKIVLLKDCTLPELENFLGSRLGLTKTK